MVWQLLRQLSIVPETAKYNNKFQLIHPKQKKLKGDILKKFESIVVIIFS